MPNPSFGSPLKLTVTTPQVASKTCSGGVNSWTTGINRITWPKVDRSSVEFADIYLQRSSVDNLPPYFPSVIATNVGPGPKSDSLWTTIRHFTNAEMAHPNEPTTYDDVVPHSTFYYYRLIFQFSHTGAV